MSTKNKNRFKQPPGITVDDVRNAMAQSTVIGQAPPSPFDGLAPGRYIVILEEYGAYSIEPEPVATEPAMPTATDIVIHCPRKQKKCVATFEVQRLADGKVEMCCNECVGPANLNTYQKML